MSRNERILPELEGWKAADKFLDEARWAIFTLPEDDRHRHEQNATSDEPWGADAQRRVEADDRGSTARGIIDKARDELRELYNHGEVVL